MSLHDAKSKQFSDLAIFTTTFYPRNSSVSDVRAPIAENFLQNASLLGVRCVVVDGGSTPDFINSIKKIPSVEVVVDEKLKMGESRRRALALAKEKYHTPFYLWTEPEKEGLITEENLEAMIEPLRQGQRDIVVPSRDEKAFASLPKFQAQMEQRANKRAQNLFVNSDGETLLEEIDTWFGPKMFDERAISYFLNYRSELDKWNAIMAPVFQAYKEGLKIGSAKVSFLYPPSQALSEYNDKEMMQKRLDQYYQLLAELGDEHWRQKMIERTKTYRT